MIMAIVTVSVIPMDRIPACPLVVLSHWIILGRINCDISLWGWSGLPGRLLLGFYKWHLRLFFLRVFFSFALSHLRLDNFHAETLKFGGTLIFILFIIYHETGGFRLKFGINFPGPHIFMLCLDPSGVNFRGFGKSWAVISWFMNVLDFNWNCRVVFQIFVSLFYYVWSHILMNINIGWKVLICIISMINLWLYFVWVQIISRCKHTLLIKLNRLICKFIQCWLDPLPVKFKLLRIHIWEIMILTPHHLHPLLFFCLFSFVMLSGFFSLVFGNLENLFFFFDLIFNRFDCLGVLEANIFNVDQE